MMMDPGLAAITLNNKGTQHLRNQNYTKAIAFFRNAVIKANFLLQKLQDSQLCSISDANTSPPPRQSNEALTLETILLESDEVDDSYPSQYSFETDESLLCKSAFVIHHDHELSYLSVTSLSLLSMCAIYNLAIAHHLSGLRLRSRQYICKAKQFYEIAYQLQEQRLFETKVLPCVCVLNNLAAICRQLGDLKRSNEVLRELLAVMEHLDCIGYKLRQCYWGVCWRNLLSLSLGKPRTAAAA
ncbi:MAG: hypothetical protein SGBAC_007901 [Bacillariaceae sp.]